jgi:hypothetical protein
LIGERHRKQFFRRHVSELRIGDERIAHQVGPASGLYLKMEPHGSFRLDSGVIEPGEDIQYHERGQALPAWRHLHDARAAIIDADRIDVLRAVFRKIRKR